MPISDPAQLKAQAEKCRRLARSSADREARILTEMAEEYDARARDAATR